MTLLDHWPTDDGEEYLTAVYLCLQAIFGKAEPEVFREAMVKAAEEAGMSVLQLKQQ